jgi:hypothetical protein
MDTTGVKQDSLGQGRFPRVDVGGNTDVTDFFEVHGHGLVLSLLKSRWKQRLEPQLVKTDRVM